MRISDWSSDVCSSDLTQRGDHEISQRACSDGRLLQAHGAEQGAGGNDDVVAGKLAQVARAEHADGAGDDRGHASPQQPVAAEMARGRPRLVAEQQRSEEHTSELQSLMRISYAVFCLKKKKYTKNQHHTT